MKRHKVYNRRSGQLEAEVSGNVNGLSFLYKSLAGKALTPIFTRKFVSQSYARYVKSRRSIKRIPSFIRQYNIDLSEVLHPVESFRCLNDFFIRELKSSSRMVDMDPGHLVSPADSRLLVFDLSVQDSLPVKGYWYKLHRFIQNVALAKQYSDGWCYVYRLAPCDYHRFCYIDNGHQETVKRIRGTLHSVNPIALASVNSLMAKNYRELTIMHTENFGTVLHFEVGALMVGKVILHNRIPCSFKKGEEKGWFEFGGSTVVQLFRKNAVQPDADLVEQSAKGIESLVKMGEKVGFAEPEIHKNA
jgi:phosphatidylserine decarboxylase